MKRILVLPLTFLLALTCLPSGTTQAAARCFPEVASTIKDCIDGRLESYWAQQGGLPLFGYPISPQHQEQTSAGTLTVQFFERTRLELHPENAQPYDVLLGRLGAEVLAKQGRDWQTFPKADPSLPHYFAETGHAIAPQFWGYWSSHGLELDGRPGVSFDESLALFGLPLSEAQAEINASDGQQYLTQWFERARFEYHPEHAGTADEVQLGLLQRELGLSDVTAAPAPPAPAASVQPGSFIQAAGGQLTLLGQPVQLRGVNYYPQWRPWGEMWTGWDGPQVERELRLARDQLGINAVRVMLPYNFTDTKNGDGKVTPKLIGRLREMAQIAGSLDMRLIVALFDFSQSFPDPGNDTKNLEYLRALIPNFADDDRIFAWDLHNEPDNYGIWTAGDPGKVLSWLGRMADAVHALAPHQLVTVGMGAPSSLWLAGPDGRRVIDYSDVVSMHTYDAGAVARDLDTLRAQTSKPILIEEFGWPTGPACVENYSEATQVRLYQSVLAAAKDRTSGVFAWMLRDYDAGPTGRWDTREDHFGLYRPDGSLKPAADLLRTIPAPPLRSANVTNLPLTSLNPHLPDGATAPVLIPESGHYIKGAFRRAWELYGGRESLGLPLSEAFVRQSDRRVVQYFEGAVLEYHPEALNGQNSLPEPDRIRLAIKPLDIGSVFTGGRALPAAQLPQGAFLDFYNRINGAWRLGGPISAELTEDVNGVATQVQYFQKGRLDLNPASQTVTVGQLGKWAWDGQCLTAK